MDRGANNNIYTYSCSKRDGMLGTDFLAFINSQSSKPEKKGSFVFVENKRLQQSAMKITK